MTDVWSDRAEAYRASATHREGPDLDLVVEWCEPASGIEALDVATGGGHVARRLREAGCTVVSSDLAPGMQPDVVCRAEDLPFADASFDVVACRIAAHHFDDVRAAVREMARVSRSLVVVEDTLHMDERVEEAEKLRDPTHVRHYTEDEWRSFFDEAGLEVEASDVVVKRIDFETWFGNTGTTGEEAVRLRELLAERSDAEGWSFPQIVFKTRKAA
jgi:ubiquinone/menaquinone biosynthesis C-methylase UbiE